MRFPIVIYLFILTPIMLNITPKFILEYYWLSSWVVAHNIGLWVLGVGILYRCFNGSSRENESETFDFVIICIVFVFHGRASLLFDPGSTFSYVFHGRASLLFDPGFTFSYVSTYFPTRFDMMSISCMFLQLKKNPYLWIRFIDQVLLFFPGMILG